jgi:cobalt/nickel transport protein
MRVPSKALLATLLLVLISPVFGVILADLVGFHEPLDIAAEELGLEDLTERINWTPLLDYTVPGLPDTVGYIVAGLIGIGVIFAIGYFMTRLVA